VPGCRAAQSGALLIRGPSWVPALRCIVKNAAPRPGHETNCFPLSEDEATWPLPRNQKGARGRRLIKLNSGMWVPGGARLTRA